MQNQFSIKISKILILKINKNVGHSGCYGVKKRKEIRSAELVSRPRTSWSNQSIFLLNIAIWHKCKYFVFFSLLIKITI